MIFHDQKILYSETTVGDCFRACLATVLGKKDVEHVPHFALLGQLHFISTVVAWLNFNGYETDTHKDEMGERYEILPLHIMRGISPRHIHHGVVGDTATGEMVHDPHPSREGLIHLNSRLYVFKDLNHPAHRKA